MTYSNIKLTGYYFPQHITFGFDWNDYDIRDSQENSGSFLDKIVADMLLPCSYTEEYILRMHFLMLKTSWENETWMKSSISEICMNLNYQQIIGLGSKVIPLILKELEQSSGYWFWALNAITGEDPVPKDKYGQIEEIRSAWLEWGKIRGII